jgi:glycosyltransferase involved in cell wall biosynthesis
MKKILFIAPHSFPIRSSESICNAKVAYCLAEAGYQVDVYTCADKSTYPADTELDQFLRTSPNLRIRTVSPDYVLLRTLSPAKMLRALGFNLRILFSTGYFYNGISIPYLIYKKVEEECGRVFDYDYILSRGYSTDLAAILLTKKYDIPWIANWNDPFPIVKFPPPYGKGSGTKLPFFENRIYKEIQKRAKLHTFPNTRLRDYMLKCFTFISREQTAIVPHMALSKISPPRSIDRNILKIVHCGNVRKPRNPRNFLLALASLKGMIESNHIKLECHFIGGVDDDIPEFIKDNDLESIVFLHNNLPYKESIDYVSKCQVSLVIEAECEEGIYLPTKVVDSFQCGVPIFCVSPENGVLNDIVSSHPVGYFSINTSRDCIRKALLRLISDYQNDKIPIVSKETVPSFFEDTIIDQYRIICD